jgi:hypothetical protein
VFVSRRLLRIEFDFCVAVLSIINPIVEEVLSYRYEGKI